MTRTLGSGAPDLGTRLQSRALAIAIVLACLMIAQITSREAAAVLSETVILQFDDDGASPSAARDSDAIDVPPDTLRDIFAQFELPLGAGFARGSVGIFGQLGVEAQMPGFAPNQPAPLEMITQISITSDENVNNLGVPLHAELNFIVDGGSLALAIAPGAFIDMQLAVVGRVLAPDRSLIRERLFVASLLLEDVSSLGANPVLTTSGDGDKLNPTLNGPIVDIPFSFQSLDLGIVDPGQIIDIEYLLTHEAEVPMFAELSPRWEFSDPPDLSVLPLQFTGNPQVPTIVFSPISSASVPAPASLALFAAGLTGLGVVRWRRRRLTYAHPV